MTNIVTDYAELTKIVEKFGCTQLCWACFEEYEPFGLDDLIGECGIPFTERSVCKYISVHATDEVIVRIYVPFHLECSGYTS